jgi:exodeoxyribonuclease VII large subunit
MQVIASGDVSVYERGGRYQLYTRFMQPDGLGDLHLAFERLKAKLEAEGLFDPARKRAIPRFPRRIAIITSPTGAAIRDITTILARRCPAAAQLVVPAIVQGEDAPASIVRALALANEVDDVDTIIVGRGGGSIEDLWAFNEEAVARAIYASARPVISAVGHETDYTIADFVADLRAPTPSAAAELAVPDQAELQTVIRGLAERLRLGLLGGLEQRRTALQQLAARRALRFPAERIQQLAQAVDESVARMDRAYRYGLERLGSRTQALCDKLEALGPAQTLARGYALCIRPADGALITRVKHLTVGDRLNVRFHDGIAGADVAELEEAAT